MRMGKVKELCRSAELGDRRGRQERQDRQQSRKVGALLVTLRSNFKSLSHRKSRLVAISARLRTLSSGRDVQRGSYEIEGQGKIVL